MAASIMEALTILPSDLSPIIRVKLELQKVEGPLFFTTKSPLKQGVKHFEENIFLNLLMVIFGLRKTK